MKIGQNERQHNGFNAVAAVAAAKRARFTRVKCGKNLADHVLPAYFRFYKPGTIYAFITYFRKKV